MRTAVWCIVALSSIAAAQEDAASLAWSSVGEAAGETRILGRGQPAALVWGAGSSVMLSAVPHVYGIAGLRFGGLEGTFRGEETGIGVAGGALQAGLTRRMHLQVMAGARIAEATGVGLGIRVSQWSFPKYEPVLETEMSFGVQVRSEPFTTGLLFSFVKQEHRPTTVDGLRFVVGSSVRVTDEVVAIIEAYDAGELELRMGARVTVVEALSMIVSWSEGSETVGAGLDIGVDGWRAVIGTRWHPVLGWSHGVDLRFAWR